MNDYYLLNICPFMKITISNCKEMFNGYEKSKLRFYYLYINIYKACLHSYLSITKHLTFEIHS